MVDEDGNGDDAENERCHLITEAAMQQAMERCGSDEAVLKQLRRMVGVDEEEGTERECSGVLDRGLDMRILSNTKRLREWVMCRAWAMVEDEGMTLSAAVSKAWAEARAAGEEQGIEV